MKKDIIWGYIAQFLQYGAALLVLPILLRRLSSAELGVWYVLLSFQSIVVLLDMGFTTTITRNVSYIQSGARKLHKEGFGLSDRGNGIDFGMMRSILGASKLIFLCLSAGAVVLMSTVGTWFMLKITRDQIPVDVTLACWAVFTVSTVLNLYFRYFTPLLQGRGLFAEFYRASAISNISFVICIAAFLLNGMGLVGIAISFLVAALVRRWLCGKYLYDAEFVHQLQSAPADAMSAREVVKVLWDNTWRYGLVLVGSFMILKTNTLVASAYLGLAKTASYSLTLQVFSTISSISVVALTIQQQRMARMRVAGDQDGLTQLVKGSIAGALLIYLICATPITLLGNGMIAAIGGHTFMLSGALLGSVALMLLLELNHSAASAIIMTSNMLKPFVVPAVASGVATVCLAVGGMQFFGFDVWWLVAVQFTVQLAYNNWRWPRMLAGELKEPYFTLLRQGCVILTYTLRAELKRR